MSTLQEQAMQMIRGLSDDNVSFLIEIIQRLMSEQHKGKREQLGAFYRLDSARTEIRQYMPEDFDADKELEEARAERYGSLN